MLDNAEIVEFDGSTPRDYAEVLNGDGGGDVRLRGYLTLPENPNGPLPLVIVGIGSAGFSAGREAFYSAELSRRGWAVLVVDSFSSRGFSETVSDQGRMTYATSVADTLNAFRFAIADSRFDPNRIALMGYSRGGHMALVGADERLQQAIVGDARFCAHVCLYPGYNPRWRHPRPTRAPMLLIVGEKDELAPLARAEAYAAQMKSAGAHIRTIVLPDAHHGFDQSHPATYHPELTNLSGSDMYIEDDGSIREETTGLVARDWPEFLRAVADKCGKKGATVGHGPAPRDVALPYIVEFFDDVFSAQD
jgi:dienelactone hydrolase